MPSLHNHYQLLIYGKDNIRSRNILGTIDSVNAITLDDLKAFYAKSISPSVARMNVVGSLDQAKISSSLKALESKWKSKAVEIPIYKTPEAPAKSQVYFYDVPDAKQSVIRIGYPALAQTDKDFYPAFGNELHPGRRRFCFAADAAVAGGQRLHLRHQLWLLRHAQSWRIH